jgi:phospholipid transport system transporter-binding protein
LIVPVQLETIGQGRYRVTGELSFATVGALLRESGDAFDSASAVDIDLSGVKHSDSAGLALLIEWLRLAKLAGKKLSYSNLPPQLLAIAQMSDVDDLLVANKQVNGG